MKDAPAVEIPNSWYKLEETERTRCYYTESLNNWCGITAFWESHFGLFWHDLNKIYILIMATGDGLRPACHHCCSALGRDTLKSLCCFHLTDVQEEGMLQSGCDCEHCYSPASYSIFIPASFGGSFGFSRRILLCAFHAAGWQSI